MIYIAISYQLLLCKKVKEKKKERMPSKPTDGCSVLARPESLHALGAGSKWNIAGAPRPDPEEPHHGIEALMPGTKQYFSINSKVTSTRLSVVSLVLSYGV